MNEKNPYKTTMRFFFSRLACQKTTRGNVHLQDLYLVPSGRKRSVFCGALTLVIFYQRRQPWGNDIQWMSIQNWLHIQCIYIIPRTQLTSVFEDQPSKIRLFSIKTRGPIWVLGIKYRLYMNILYIFKDGLVSSTTTFFGVLCFGFTVVIFVCCFKNSAGFQALLCHHWGWAKIRVWEVWVLPKGRTSGDVYGFKHLLTRYLED